MKKTEIKYFDIVRVKGSFNPDERWRVLNKVVDTFIFYKSISYLCVLVNKRNGEYVPDTIPFSKFINENDLEVCNDEKTRNKRIRT